MLSILKLVILFIVFAICTSIGIIKAKTYDSRSVELKKIKNSLEVLRTKIEFTYEPLKDIFLEISEIVYSDEKNIFYDTTEFMKKYNVDESWKMAVSSNSNLIKEDKETLKMFSKLLGKTDKSGQINEINVTTKLLDTLIEKAEIEKSKNYKLFKTIGSLVGIGLCIILI